MIFHGLHPYTDAVQQYFRSSHLLDEGRRRLHIKHRGKVARTEEGVLDEIVGLLRTAGTGGEEMIGSTADTVITRIVVVVDEVFIRNRSTFRTLDIAEGNGIVNGSRDTFVALRSQMRDADLAPVDTVGLLSDVVLVA